jgi:hypothetical protein
MNKICFRSSVTWDSLQVVELEGTCVTPSGLDQLLASLPHLTCLQATVFEDYLQALQAAAASEDDLSRQPNLRLTDVLKSAALSPVGLQRLSLSIDRPGDGAVMSQLSLMCRLFSQLTSLKLHHVHREEWPYLPVLADLKVSKVTPTEPGTTEPETTMPGMTSKTNFMHK